MSADIGLCLREHDPCVPLLCVHPCIGAYFTWVGRFVCPMILRQDREMQQLTFADQSIIMIL